MKSEIRKLTEIRNNPENPRYIRDEKFNKLVKSLKDFPEMIGARPLVVNQRMEALGGNMRLKAMIEAGWTECPVIQVDWSEEKQREFIIKDNLGYGEWDWDMLANEWNEEELQDWGMDTPDTWAEEELEAEEDDYSIPEEIKTDVVLGDLIEIGEHRLLCGDSTDSDQVAKLMNGEKADMVFTDPPWNVNYGAVEKGNAQGYKPRTILNDKMSTDDFKDFMSSSFSMMSWGSKEGCPTYVVMSAQEWGNLMIALHENDYHWSSTIIWAKDRLVLSRKDYHTQYEPIWYGWKRGASRLMPLQDRTQSDVWQFDRPSVSELHPTTKPIDLVSRAIENSSKRGNLIFELFTGSGSTMVAAHQLKRKCYGMELDPKYCQVILDRMQKLDPALSVKINGKEYVKTTR